MLLPLHLSFHEIDPIPHSREVYILLFSLFFYLLLLLLMVSVSPLEALLQPRFILRTWHKSKRREKEEEEDENISKRQSIRRELNEDGERRV